MGEDAPDDPPVVDERNEPEPPNASCAGEDIEAEAAAHQVRPAMARVTRRTGGRAGLGVWNRV